MANNGSALRVVTVTIGGIVYTAKPTIGMYAKACDIAGVDVSVLFSGQIPTAALVQAFAQVVTGLTAEQTTECMMMSEYAGVIEAIMAGVVPGNAEEQTPAAPTSTDTDDAPKN